MRDNKCGSPHHQSWDRKNQRPSRFYAFGEHPFLYPSPLKASREKKKGKIKYNKTERVIDPMLLWVSFDYQILFY